jgi:DNA-binding MarR family transcriptional regulator
MSDEIRDQAARIVETMPRVMRRLFTLDTADPASELPIGQLKLCGVLREGPRTMSEVARELGVTLSAATQLADRLERTGLVEKSCELDDRRVKLLRLSALGDEMMRKRRERRAARVEQALRTMSLEARTALMSALELLGEASKSLTLSGKASQMEGEEI